MIPPFNYPSLQMEVYGGERLVNTILIIIPSDDDIHFSRLNLMYSLKNPEKPSLG